MFHVATATAAPAQDPTAIPIDRAHLSQMTLGDARLEREILQLFDRQAEQLVERMRQAPPPAVSALAHTLKGSARGIGAWNVARAAEMLELADGTIGEFRAALDALTSAVVATRAEIGKLLQAH